MTPYDALQELKQWKGEQLDDRLVLLAGGVEAEFTLLVNDRPAKPEDVFGDPRGFVTVPLMHRVGRSFHLPTGAAIYFDTGVIEIASPVMELERGCFGRLARSMEVTIELVRSQLDDWERRTGRSARLQGFSTHYNVSVADGHGGAASQRIRELSWLLTHILPAPVMLLGTNRRSTGVGTRPRPRRIEVTADFPPDPARLAATGSVVAGIISAVSQWHDLSVHKLHARGVPIIDGFRPRRHTSRRGWLARHDCYPANPFESGAPNGRMWSTSLGEMNLREIAWRTFNAFRESIRRLSDPFSHRTASRILSGASPSWLDQNHRPAAYDDVGRGTALPRELSALGLSRYERVMLNAIEARPLQLAREQWTPIGVRGWSRVVFRRNRDGARTVLPLDTLVTRLEDWS